MRPLRPVVLSVLLALACGDPEPGAPTGTGPLAAAAPREVPEAAEPPAEPEPTAVEDAPAEPAPAPEAPRGTPEAEAEGPTYAVAFDPPWSVGEAGHLTVRLTSSERRVGVREDGPQTEHAATSRYALEADLEVRAVDEDGRAQERRVTVAAFTVEEEGDADRAETRTLLPAGTVLRLVRGQAPVREDGEPLDESVGRALLATVEGGGRPSRAFVPEEPVAVGAGWDLVPNVLRRAQPELGAPMGGRVEGEGAVLGLEEIDGTPCVHARIETRQTGFELPAEEGVELPTRVFTTSDERWLPREGGRALRIRREAGFLTEGTVETRVARAAVRVERREVREVAWRPAPSGE